MGHKKLICCLKVPVLVGHGMDPPADRDVDHSYMISTA